MKELQFTINGNVVPAIDLSEMTSQEWDVYRKNSLRIGGSEIGTILGLNLYEDPMTLFFKKTGFMASDFVPSEATEGGHLDEAAILTRLEHYDGFSWAQHFRDGKKFRKIVKPNVTFLPESHPYLALNVDGLIEDDPEYQGTGIAEAKKIGFKSFQSYPGNCPPSYLAQVTAYMIGLNAEFGRIALLEDGVRLHVRTLDKGMEEFEAMKELIETICPRFYQAVLDARQVLALELDKFDKHNLFMEVLAEYSDIIRVTDLSKSAIDAMSEDGRKGVLKTSLYDSLFEHYEQATSDSSQADKWKKQLENEICMAIVQEKVLSIEGTSHKVNYNKRLTFKRI
jgi:hypothetical protein